MSTRYRDKIKPVTEYVKDPNSRVLLASSFSRVTSAKGIDYSAIPGKKEYVARFYSPEEAGGTFRQAAELVEGRNLGKLVRQLPENEVLVIVESKARVIKSRKAVLEGVAE